MWERPGGHFLSQLVRGKSHTGCAFDEVHENGTAPLWSSNNL